MPSVRRRRSRGASLIEVLTASAILALLLAIGLPNTVALRQPYLARAASRQIEADLQRARMRAIGRNARYRVNFTAGGRYTIERETAPNSNAWVAEGGTQAIPRGATLGAIAPNNPIFDTRGMLAADVSVPVAASGGHTRTVTVNVLGQTTIN
jgi:prepilin-type N-terminal cleavage/methylation domain-containing protein